MRTQLLEVTDDDFAAMLRCDAFVRPGLAQPPGGVEEPPVLRHVRHLAAALRNGGFAGGHWMMVAGGEVVGLCGFKAAPGADGEVEIGYGVAASRRRRGHAREAVAQVVALATRDPQIASLLAVTALDNVASQRVLERNAFQRTGTQHGASSGVEALWRRLVKC